MKLLPEAFSLTVIGMATVFASLIVIMFVIQIMEWFFSDGNGSASSGGKAVEEASPAKEENEKQTDVVVAAATAYFLETEEPDIFIPPVTRPGRSEWARRARTAAALSRRSR